MFIAADLPRLLMKDMAGARLHAADKMAGFYNFPMI
jgi:hypothetical protein